MTVVTRTHYLRPYNLSGAAKRSRAEKIKKLLEYGLMRDQYGRKMILLDYKEAELRLKERQVDDR